MPLKTSNTSEENQLKKESMPIIRLVFVLKGLLPGTIWRYSLKSKANVPLLLLGG